MGKDHLTKARRSWNMSRIRGKDTTPERVVRSLLHRMGYRFRLHVRIPVAAVYDRGILKKKWNKAALPCLEVGSRID